MNQIYVAWTAFIRRPESMQKHFGYHLKFLPPPFKMYLLKPLGYLINSYKTFNLLLRTNPNVVWIQLAPPILLYVVFFYRLLFNRQFILISDCHNSMFRRHWLSFPFAIKLLNLSDLVIVHNNKIRDKALNVGIGENALHVLETRPANISTKVISSFKLDQPLPRPWIVMPCSFDNDEPIATTLEAARKIPNTSIIITGDTSRARRNHKIGTLPDNVVTTGFLSKSHYNSLLQEADAIMGLTLRDDIQLSVANEAVGIVKPMVISNSELLQSLFNKGAIFVNPKDAESIANGCTQVLQQKDRLIQGVHELRLERNSRWGLQAKHIENVIGTHPT